MTDKHIKKIVICLSLFCCCNFKAFASQNYSYNNYQKNSPNDYFNQTANMQQTKWTKFPVTVYTGNVPIEYKETTINAINHWKTYFPLELSDNPNSDVDILWVNRFSANTSKNTLGTTTHIVNNGTHKCTIRVKNKKFIKTELNEIMLHELGHAVGLGESPYKSDIMYPIVKCKKGKITKWTLVFVGYIPIILPSGYDREIAGKSTISQQDLNTLAKIYPEPQTNENIHLVNNSADIPLIKKSPPNNQIVPQQDQLEVQDAPSNKYIELGNKFYKIQNYNKAIENYNKAVEMNLNDVIANQNIGICYISMKNYDTAISHLNKMLFEYPNNESLYVNLGLSYKGKGLYDKAIESYKNAILINPNCISAYVNLSAIYIDTKKYDLAIKNCKKAIDINPNCEIAYNNLGEAYKNKGENDKAMELFRKALSINPNSTLVKSNYNNLNYYMPNFRK